MKPQEWDQIVLVIAANWPHKIPPDSALGKWYGDLADLPAAHVAAAVEALYRDGREFCPNGAQIRARAIELAIDKPEWADVLKALGSVVGKPTNVFIEGEFYDRRAEALDRQPEMIRAFVRDLGWEQISSGLTGNGSDEARLRQKWDAWSSRIERDAKYAGIEPAGLAQLEAPKLKQIGGAS